MSNTVNDIFNNVMSNKIYRKIIAILFFVFFATPILSPSLLGYTLYLYLIIPLFDFNFIKFVYNILIDKKSRKYMIFISLLSFISILFLKISFSIELVAIIEVIFYLVYLYKNELFKYLYLVVNINIIIAIIQFIGYYIDPNFAYSIGPTNVSKILWGEFAAQTNTNIFPNELGIVRVSGWSREAGFFASLIILTFMIYQFVDKKTKKYVIQYILFGIAFLISFSKVSVIIVMIIPMLLLKKYIDKIPYFVPVIGVIILGILVSNGLWQSGQYDPENSKNYGTFAHRFSGYTIMTQMDFKELFFGIDNINDLKKEVKNEHTYLEHIYQYNQFCGLPHMLIHNGIIIFIMFIFGLKFFGFRTSDFCIITLITLTVNYTTVTSFVILGYFLVLSNISRLQKNNDELQNEII